MRDRSQKKAGQVINQQIILREFMMYAESDLKLMYTEPEMMHAEPYMVYADLDARRTLNIEYRA